MRIHCTSVQNMDCTVGYVICIYIHVHPHQSLSVGAQCFLECSALTGDHVDEVFFKVIDVYESNQSTRATRRRFKWPWQKYVFKWTYMCTYVPIHTHTYLCINSCLHTYICTCKYGNDIFIKYPVMYLCTYLPTYICTL